MSTKSFGSVVVQYKLSYKYGTQRDMTSGKPGRIVRPLSGGSDGDYVSLNCPNFHLAAHVRVRNPEGLKLRIGFTQTIYYSRRDWYYFTQGRTIQTDYVANAPVWDGMREDECPWFDAPDETGDAAYEDDVYFCDSPSCSSYEEDPHLNHFCVASVADPTDPLRKPSLFHVTGEDSFHCWLAVEIGGKVHLVDGVPWHVKYAALVDPFSKEMEPLQGSGMYLGVKGRGWKNQARLDGDCGEAHIRVSRSSWRKGELSLRVREHVEGLFSTLL